ncbi:MAG: alpha-N-arabinofuranosidase [Planctomycetes bacterium]|nr:alpha-N-arabinofuranosidase [Planctomycetota bacterium]
MNEIRIDLRRRLGRIDRKTYGHFVEHLGRCVYQGIYEPESPLADSSGLRRDVLEAARGLQIPILRWPGGNFASGYHWLDGVGHRSERPRRVDLAWNAIETNQFGTNEFIECCRAMGCEPYLCANLGNGSIDEAQAWVEYCNGSNDTAYANLRRRHGYDQPHGVKYWGLGNELYGAWQIGHKSAQEYARVALEFAKVMKWVDPEIRLVACGAQHMEWDWEVLKTLGPRIDYISAHFYFAPEAASGVPADEAASRRHYSLLAVPRQVEDYVRILWQLIQAARRQFRLRHEIRIALDEWNVWYRARVPEHKLEDRREAPPQLEETYDLTDALCVAAFLNMLRRQCAAIGMANLAQLVNVIAPIRTRPVSAEDDRGLFLQTIYHPLRMAVEHSGPVALDSWVECESYESSRPLAGQVPYLDVCATLDESLRRLFLSVVNLHHRDAVDARILLHEGQWKRKGLHHSLTAGNIDAVNSFDEPDRICQVTARLRKLANPFTFSFPPRSANVLEFELEG